MSAIYKLYKKNNYTIQKSINIEDGLYTKIKEIVEKEYDASISEVINICVEELIEHNNVRYYEKPAGEIVLYRSIMLRKESVEQLNKIKRETGISVTRLVNLAMKEFIDRYNKT